MYLKRKIDKYLIDWKNNPARLPLIVRGARQVGKTEAILHFAQENYANYIEINFVEEPACKSIIEEGFSVDSIIKLISRIHPEYRFVPNETLIFFDEIQDFPEIATALKFFKTDGRFDIICSGSLLGIQYKHIDSHSVGYKTDYQLRSFDFEEFLWALGYQEDIAEDMLQHMRTYTPFTGLEHKKYSSLFMDYVLLGGMPAVLRQFVTTHTFEHIGEIQNQLLLDYYDDIRKYADSLDQTKITAVFNQVAPQLAKENKKFQLTKIAKGARSREYFGCVEWLKDAGVISICYCMNFPELPLKGNYDPGKYKLYIADTGLLIAMLDEEAAADLRSNQNLGVYKGALYENFVAEALSKSGYDLYYYKRDDSTMEIDFLVRTAHDLIPVEVKAGTTVSKSLRNLIASDHYPTVTCGIKFANANIGKTETITTFPYFCAFLLKRFLQGTESKPFKS